MDRSYDSTKSAPMKTSDPAQPENASSSPVDHRATPACRRTDLRPARTTAGGVDGRRTRSTDAATTGTSGTTIQARRQLASPRNPTAGIPTIHATGGPSSTIESTRERASDATHSAAAATATEYDIPIPAPTSAWAAAS